MKVRLHPTKEEQENYKKEALIDFKGTIILVCHEPEFYNGLVTDVLDAEKWTTKLI